ncbi:MAG: hypothetical protein ACTSRY_08600 [Alphaproteobacteria bacterium]
MRPEILYPLFHPVTDLPGIGPRIGKLFEKIAGARIVDLLWHLPSGLIDRRFAPPVADAPDGVVATLTVTVEAHQPPPGRSGSRLPYRVICSDPTGQIALVFFHARADYLEKILPIGAKRIVSGRVEHFRGRPQMSHPDHVAAPDELATLARVEPVYPLTAGLTPKPLTRAVAAALKAAPDMAESALKAAPDMAEWIDPAYLARQGWPDWRAALLTAHAPESEADLAPGAPARMRLAFDELLASQLAIALMRAQTRRLAGRALTGDGALRAKVVAALPFQLTASQTGALDEILADMGAPRRMSRGARPGRRSARR